MGALSEIVESLEIKLAKLQLKLEMLQTKNHDLEQAAARAAHQISRQDEEIAVLKQQNESLRTANSLLGSDENKRETKLRINSLIRDIDYCIAQLSE
jgi:chromosome segregation ATPase